MGTLCEARRVDGQGGLVIDVTGLYPFDLSKTARRPRPRKDNSFILVRRTRPTCHAFIGRMGSICAECQHASLI